MHFFVRWKTGLTGNKVCHPGRRRLVSGSTLCDPVKRHADAIIFDQVTLDVCQFNLSTPKSLSLP